MKAIELRALLDELEKAKEEGKAVALLPAIRLAIKKLEEDVT